MSFNDPSQNDSCVPPTPLLRSPHQVPPWLYTTLIVPQMICTYLYYQVPINRFYFESCPELWGFFVPLSHFQYTSCRLLWDPSRPYPWSFLHTYPSHRDPIHNRPQETYWLFQTLRCWTFFWYSIYFSLMSPAYQTWKHLPHGLT